MTRIHSSLSDSTGSRARYKRDTQVVINFLARFHKPRQNGVQGVCHDVSMSQSDMLRCAEEFSFHRRKCPKEILTALQSAIDLRVEVGALYKQITGEECADHRRFIDLLRRIYDLLTSPTGPAIEQYTSPRDTKNVYSILEHLPEQLKNNIGCSSGTSTTRARNTDSDENASRQNHGAVSAAHNGYYGRGVLSDEPDQEHFAAMCVLKDLSSLYNIVERQWKEFEMDKLDLESFSLMLSLAVAEMKAIGEEFAREYPRLNTAREFYQALGVELSRIDGPGGGSIVLIAKGTKLYGDVPSDNASLWHLFHPQSYINLLDVCKTRQKLEPSIADDPKRSNTHSERGNKIPDRRIKFTRLMDDPTDTGYVFGCDAYIDALKEAMETGQIPIWLPCAQSSTSWVIDGLAANASTVLHVQLSFCNHVQTSMRSAVNMVEDERISRCVNATYSLAKQLNTHAGSTGTQPTTKETSYLRSFSCPAHVLGHRIKVEMHHVGIALCNHNFALAAVALLYLVFRKSGLLTRTWQDMEYVLKEHENEFGALVSLGRDENCGLAAFLEFASSHQHRAFTLLPRPPRLDASNIGHASPLSILHRVYCGYGDEHGNASVSRGRESSISTRMLEVAGRLAKQNFEMHFNYVKLLESCITAMTRIGEKCAFAIPENTSSPLSSITLCRLLEQGVVWAQANPDVRNTKPSIFEAASHELGAFIEENGGSISKAASLFLDLLAPSKMICPKWKRFIAQSERVKQIEQEIDDIWRGIVSHLTGSDNGGFNMRNKKTTIGRMTKEGEALWSRWIYKRMKNGNGEDEKFKNQLRKLVNRYNHERQRKQQTYS